MADLTNTSPNVADVEREVEARSGVLKKELGLFDLVLSQVVFVAGFQVDEPATAKPYLPLSIYPQQV